MIRLADEQEKTLPEIKKTVVLNAEINSVWKAVSTAEGLEHWWMPGTIEPVMGKVFVLRTFQYGDSWCRITELDPPNLIGFDWDDDWHLSFHLKDLGEGRTEFTLIHSGWKSGTKNRFGLKHDDVYGVMEDGWSKIVTVDLVKYVEEHK